MNNSEKDEETERKKFEKDYLRLKKIFEFMERLKREFGKARFKKLYDKERGYKGDGGGH